MDTSILFRLLKSESSIFTRKCYSIQLLQNYTRNPFCHFLEFEWPRTMVRRDKANVADGSTALLHLVTWELYLSLIHMPHTRRLLILLSLDYVKYYMTLSEHCKTWSRIPNKIDSELSPRSKPIFTYLLPIVYAHFVGLHRLYQASTHLLFPGPYFPSFGL